MKAFERVRSPQLPPPSALTTPNPAVLRKLSSKAKVRPSSFEEANAIAESDPAHGKAGHHAGASAATAKPEQTGIVPVMIEVPQRTPNKYELEKKWGLLSLDRVLHSAVFYPGDYGYVPNTLCGDGDPIDVLVLSTYALDAGVMVDCRIIGAMDMEDENGEDWKLLCVIDKDPRAKDILDLCNISRHRVLEIEHFFANYKKLEDKPGHKKWAKILGFYDKKRALEVYQDSIKLYEKAHQGEDEDEDVAIADYGDAPRDLLGITRAGAVPRRDQFPKLVQAYIECPKGYNNKYEFDHDTGFMKLDRVLHSAVFYPYDYGFVPRTLCGDGDPLDVMVLSTYPLAAGTMVDVRVIGVMDMEDEKGQDAKLLGVVHADPRWLEIIDLDDVALHIQTEIRNFFETYKSLEGNKWAKVTGWRSREDAIKEVLITAAEYDKNPKQFRNPPKLYHIPIGEKMPEIVNAIVECPKGSTNKYKFCKEVGLLKLDRVFHSSTCYPGNYGFIPQTLGEDGNPVDVLVLSPFSLTFQCVVAVRVVALLNMEDERGPDCKIIGVPVKEPRCEEIVDLGTIPEHQKKEIQNFFLTYKDLEDKTSFVRFRGWEDKPAALLKLKQGHELFYLFGQRMDAAEDKINELELENNKLKTSLTQLQTIERRLAALEGKK